MKILLIGKYPPIQGGISSKTYWLYRELETRGFDYRVVTVEAKDYTIFDGDIENRRVSIMDADNIPWHIPESSLIADRIFNKAIKIAETYHPDIIETNYLWPFCMPSALVSSLIEKPWLIRHAGSDIQKFYHDQDFKDIMAVYFSKASMVVTNHTLKTTIEKLCGDSAKVVCLKKYIPNPELFTPSTLKKIDILFAGKINYRWHLKGLKYLVAFIKHKDLTSLFVTGGKYSNELNRLIAHLNASDLIQVRDFVHPKSMPELYKNAKFVWCWQENEGVSDFSNLIWEALYAGTPCIVNKETANKLSDEGVPPDFKGLIYAKTPEELMDFDILNTTVGHSGLEAVKSELYKDYIHSNIELYNHIVEVGR